jgi:hypothetical protein
VIGPRIGEHASPFVRVLAAHREPVCAGPDTGFPLGWDAFDGQDECDLLVREPMANALSLLVFG